jgi:type II secretory pathway pseudopilin PulG
VEIVVVAATSAALALAALVVSVLLIRRQADLEAVEEVLARRQADLQDRVAALEAARRAEAAEAGRRARVTAQFDRSFRVLHIINDGPAAARGVTVELRPIGGGRPPALDLRGLPTDLRPGQRLFLDAEQPSLDGAPSMTATVRWTDDTGAQDETFVLPTQF